MEIAGLKSKGKNMSKNLRAKLALVRTQLSITKDGVNKFGGYNYYQIDDIYAKAKTLFQDNGIFTSFNQEHVGEGTITTKAVMNRDGSIVSDKNGEGVYETVSLPLIKSILTVYDTESDEEIVFSNISNMNDSKGTQPAQNAGANVTYQSKYNYLTLLLLDDGADDPDKNNEHGKQKKSVKSIKPSMNDDLL